MTTPSLHFPTLTRAAILVALAGLLARVYAFNDVITPRVEGWIAFAIVEILLLVVAGRLVWLDARAPGPRVFVARTREMASIIEIVIAGFGAAFLFGALFIALGFGADEVRNGQVDSYGGPKGGELVPAIMFALFAFPMIFWRPTFLLDLDRRTVKRYAFGRALPLRIAEHPLSSVQIVAEGYYRTNTGIRYGDMIRGKVGGATFELEFIPGNVGPEALSYPVQQWQRAFGASGPPAAPPPNVPVPRGWMWGYLHLRHANLKGFGFLYVDPVGGPSFHIVSENIAPLDPAGLQAAGYRGQRTARLGAYETLHSVPGLEAMQRQSFEEGSVTGAVVLALNPQEQAALALPAMPPWAHHYLASGSA